MAPCFFSLRLRPPPQSYIDKTLLPPETATAAKKKQKQKASFQQTMQVLFASVKIRSVAALVVSYGLCHRLFEVCWKGQLRAVYPSAEQFGAALGDVGTWTGIVTIISMLTVRETAQILRARCFRAAGVCSEQRAPESCVLCDST